MQVHAELPITLILGMATSAGALQQMLPVAAASMLEAQHFQLASSMERYTICCRGLAVCVAEVCMYTEAHWFHGCLSQAFGASTMLATHFQACQLQRKVQHLLPCAVDVSCSYLHAYCNTLGSLDI